MIKIENYNKTFRLKSGDVRALEDVCLEIEDGEKYGVIGYSGAGKSTLVRCINFLEIPDSGRLTVSDFGSIDIVDGKLFNEDGRRIAERDLKDLRKGIGMIFQHFNLLDRSTVFENVAFSLKYSGMTKKEISDKVFGLLDLVGLTDKADVYPSQLSGGQKQRVAIARALVNDPKILLSDEATSALDPDATESILNLLNDLNRELGLTIIIITHEMSVIKAVCDRVAVMEGGRVVEEGRVYDIFSQPVQPITRKFVNSTSSMAKADLLTKRIPSLGADGGHIYRLYFDSNVYEPVISNISRKFNVDCNILLGNVEVIGNEGLGSLVIKMLGKHENIEQALEYLKQANVRTEVIA